MFENGMKESVDKVAILENVDAETFERFVQFVYTKTYWASTDDDTTPLSLPVWSNCTKCGEVLTIDGVCPKDCMEDKSRAPPRVCGSCVKELTEPNVFCHGCFERGTVYPQLISFCNLEYPVLGMSHDKARAFLAGLGPEDPPTSKLVRHAELFVFANTYLIDDLQELCLHKLHQDLLVFDLKENGAGEVVDLLEYCYCNTEQADKDFPGVGAELRELVIAYATAMAGDLVCIAEFRTMLEKGGILASDFMFRTLTARKQN